ncbi:MAG: hypothetical protein WEC59_04590, partial [Salibacteraceae bacterium]
MIKRLISLREHWWLQMGSVLVMLYLFIKYLDRIINRFSSIYVDPDQVLMMFAAQEFSKGRFHMPRFFGQNYGSMLESIIAVPLSFLSYESALSISTCLLWLLPFALMLRMFGSSLKTAMVILLWLLIMPVEYAFLGTMPRDFVSGIAVTSLAFIIFKKEKNWALFLIGFICLTGWSFNANAALLGGVITIFKIASKKDNWLKTSMLIGAGYGVGFIAHLTLQFYLSLHPEWIVHEAWPTSFDLNLISVALSKLDVMWAALTPFIYKKAWIYVVLFAGIITWSIIKNNKPVLWAALTLIFLLVASFAMPKVHDGYLSIFSPYERMFLALPVVVLFLILHLNLHKKWPVMILLLIG